MKHAGSADTDLIRRRVRLAVLGCALAAASAGCAKGLLVPDPTPLVPIAAGTFTLGATVATGAECQVSICPGEYVPHVVTLSRPFKIETTEVTVRQYAAFEAFNTSCKGGANSVDLDRGDEPAQVNIESARSYCHWRKRRLPTAAEWEVAARVKADGVGLQRFPWGDSPKTCTEVPAGGGDCPGQKTPSVGTNTIDRTPLGVRDMAGGLPEWVEDDYTPGAACEFQTPTSVICGGDQTCVQRFCAAVPQGCAGSCGGSSGGGGQCGGLQDTGRNTFCAPSGRALVDPLHVTFDHSRTICVGDYNPNNSGNPGGSNGHNPAAMVKGGGITMPICAQDPAAFAVPPNNSGPNSNQRYGFRCVEGDLPTPRGVVRLQSNNGSNSGCAKITLGLAAGSQPPPGWGTDIRAVLTTSQGIVVGTFRKPPGVYDLDPTPLCQGQQPGGGPGPSILLMDVPPATFDLQVGVQDMNRRCDVVATAHVDTTVGESSVCNGERTNLNEVSCTPIAPGLPPACMNANPDCVEAAASYCACCGNSNKAICGSDSCSNGNNLQAYCNADSMCGGNCRNYIIGVDICANFKAMGFCGI